MFIVKIDRERFTNICRSKLDKNDHLYLCRNDIEWCASEFGFKIDTYLFDELICTCVDEQKLMLFKIKYEI